MKKWLDKVMNLIFEDTSKLNIEERLDRLEGLHQGVFLLQIASSMLLIKLILGL